MQVMDGCFYERLYSNSFFRANIAAASGGIIFFMLYLPYSFMVVWEEKLDPNAKFVSVRIAFLFDLVI